MRVSVITISDRAYRGVYEDLSGPEIESIIMSRKPEWTVDRDIVPDEPEKIEAIFERRARSDYILTTGGTGLSSRDITPEVTEKYCDRILPGIGEYLRTESLKETPYAVLSRGTAGIKGSTIIVNFPGSLKAARLCISLLIPIMEHGMEMLKGGDHK